MKLKETHEQQVLKSAAGYYVGTLYFDEEFKAWWPNSRDTDYMTKAEAKDMLKYWKKEEEEMNYVTT